MPGPVPRVLRERDYGALDKSQFSLFVQFFRQASPYIEGHRGRTFVLAIPGEVRCGNVRCKQLAAIMWLWQEPQC